ncbi:AzlD domain-containing protein [Halorubrum sp. HHNYT27]|uniref:AzlD domain-containing protein n=1 Tax=Halorubrum sp. HHNYT27 TaxID=3402275 RepID=UPI003EBEC856
MIDGIPELSIWPLFIIIGIGIFAIRLSFIQLHSTLGGIPPEVERALKFVPAAIIAAIVFPDVFVVESALTDLDGVLRVIYTPRVFAALSAAIIARYTGSILATVGVGMALLWTHRLLLG